MTAREALIKSAFGEIRRPGKLKKCSTTRRSTVLFSIPGPRLSSKIRLNQSFSSTFAREFSVEREHGAARQAGHVIVELALILPVIVGLAFAGLEFARFLRYSQVAATLSREVASVSYRSCMAEENVAENPDAVSECLNLERARLQTNVSMIVPGIQLIASLYQYDSVSETVNRLGIAGEGPKTSKFTAATLPPDVIALVQAHVVVVVGEAYVPYGAIISGIAGFYNFNPGELYDRTVI